MKKFKSRLITLLLNNTHSSVKIYQSTLFHKLSITLHQTGQKFSQDTVFLKTHSRVKPDKMLTIEGGLIVHESNKSILRSRV